MNSKVKSPIESLEEQERLYATLRLMQEANEQMRMEPECRKKFIEAYGLHDWKKVIPMRFF